MSRAGIRIFSNLEISFLNPARRTSLRGQLPVRTLLSQRTFSSSIKMEEKFAPAKRVAGQRQDVWSIVNEAAAASPKQPIGKTYIAE